MINLKNFDAHVDTASNVLNSAFLASAVGLATISMFGEIKGMVNGNGHKTTTIPTIELQKISPIKHDHGELVPVKEIMDQKLPETFMQEVKAGMEKHKTGVIVSKKYHLYYFFVDGKLLKFGPVGTANPNILNNGVPSSTPPGVYKLEQMRAGRSRSAENGEFMYNTMFYYPKTGHAIHGSDNFLMQGEQLNIIWDNSHGCINIPRDEAKYIFDTLALKFKNRKQTKEEIIVDIRD